MTGPSWSGETRGVASTRRHRASSSYRGNELSEAGDHGRRSTAAPRREGIVHTGRGGRRDADGTRPGQALGQLERAILRLRPAAAGCEISATVER